MIFLNRDVFISYSRADTAQAMELKAVLERNGISCWIDEKEIMPGTDYTWKIPEGMDHAKVFLLVFSPRSQSSDWVERELKYAVGNRMFLIPYMLEEFPLEKNFKFLISSANYLQAWRNPEEAKRLLVEQIRRQLAVEEAPPAITEVPFWEKTKEKKPIDRKKLIHRGVIAAGGAAIAVVLILTCGAIRDRSFVRGALKEAETFARSGDYPSAMEVLREQLEDYPGERRLEQAMEEYQQAWSEQKKEDALTQAQALMAGGDPAGALGVIAPWAGTDEEAAALYDECAGMYSRQTLDAARELQQQERYAEALILLRSGLKTLPEDQQMRQAFDQLAELDPVPVEDQRVGEQHVPDDATVLVSVGKWDPETERDINMNTWSGGLRVCVGDLLSNTISFVHKDVTSRVAWEFYPENHTGTRFSGYIVLGDQMYGQKTRGTIRILVNGEEVFSTGLIDGSCTEPVPFSVDITGVHTIVFEAEITLLDSVFEYGIVS